jgi:hypothetical protein
MTAAILQGVPATTLDTDIWLELPERRYVKALDIAKKLGAEILARTVVALDDDTLVNFLYRIDGLKTFADEYERAEVLDWLGRQIRVRCKELSTARNTFAAQRTSLISHS